MSTAMADVPAPKQIKDFDMNDLKSQLDATSRKPVVGLKRTNSVERKQKVDIMVVGARHLPTMDPTVFDPRQSHALAAAADSISQAVGTCNAVYIHLKYGNKQVETTMRWDEKNPVWNEKFAFTLPLVDPSTEDDGTELEVSIVDRPVGTADKLLGKVTIKGAGLYNAPIEGEADPILLELVVRDGNGQKLMGQDKKAASITLQVNQRKAASANARSSIIASRGASHIKHGNQT